MHPQRIESFISRCLLQPMKDWHLRSEFQNGKAVGGLIDYLKLFSIIGLLVMMIACINFMNLSTARSQKRAREVGVRKVIGSTRKGFDPAVPHGIHCSHRYWIYLVVDLCTNGAASFNNW